MDSLLLCVSAFVRHSYCGIVAVLLLNALQEKRCAEKRDQGSSQQDYEIAKIKLYAGVIHVHQAKSAAKVSKGKKF